MAITLNEMYGSEYLSASEMVSANVKRLLVKVIDWTMRDTQFENQPMRKQIVLTLASQDERFTGKLFPLNKTNMLVLVEMANIITSIDIETPAGADELNGKLIGSKFTIYVNRQSVKGKMTDVLNISVESFEPPVPIAKKQKEVEKILF